MRSLRKRRPFSLVLGTIALSILLGLTLASCDDESSPTKNTPVNRAPNAPALDSVAGAPGDGATDVASPITLHWTCSDPDGDDLTYAVHFGTDEDPPVLADDLDATSHGPMAVAAATTFYWNVVATDPDGMTTESAVWSFVTEAEAGPETMTQPAVAGGPSGGDVGQDLAFTPSGAVSSIGDGVQYRFDWGDETTSAWSASGLIHKSWAAPDVYAVKVQARCATHNEIESTWSAARNVTILALETLSNPHAPTGPAGGETNATLDFTASGATNSRGHEVQYRFDWGDGLMSNWSASTTASHAWNTEGAYDVRVMARCQTHTDLQSEWSATSQVNIVLPGEVLTRPGNGAGAIGPVSGAVGVDQSFKINWPATSNLGHVVEHQFDWDDGEQSAWGTAMEATHAWSAEGSYTVKIRGRCIEHPGAVSDWSSSDPIEITAASETISDPQIQLYANPVAYSPVTFQVVGAASNIGDTLEYQMDWGIEGLSEWKTGTSFRHAFTHDGIIEMRVRARCQAHPEIITDWSPVRNQSVAEGVSGVDHVSPTSGYAGDQIEFSIPEVVNSSGHAVEYQFSWGGSEGYSDWVSTPTATHTYENPNTQSVRVTARCVTDPTVSRTGPTTAVYITWRPTTETITQPDKPAGPATGVRNTPITFSTTVCTSNEGHEVWYRFRAYRSGSLQVATEWSASPVQEMTFTQTGGHSIYADARCSLHPEANSTAYTAGYINIVNP